MFCASEALVKLLPLKHKFWSNAAGLPGAGDEGRLELAHTFAYYGLVDCGLLSV